MSNLFSLCYHATAALVALWLLLRIGFFLWDRVGGISPSPGLFRFSIWLHRIALLLISLEGIVVFGFVALLLSGYGSSEPGMIVAAFHCTTIYALLAFLLNLLPGIPLRFHARAIFPLQLLLAPAFWFVIEQRMPFLPALLWALPFILFAIFWRWNLHDRLATEDDTAFVAPSEQPQIRILPKQTLARSISMDDEQTPAARESDSWTSL